MYTVRLSWSHVSVPGRLESYRPVYANRSCEDSKYPFYLNNLVLTAFNDVQNKLYPLTMDPLAHHTMKNAAKCDT